MLSRGCSNVVLFFFHAVWQEILRGPRPPAARWPRADGNVQRNSSRAGRDSLPVQGPRNPVAGRRGSVHGQDQRRLNPEEVMVNARMRVTKLESALAAVGQEDPAHPILFEALQHVRSQAQIWRRGSEGSGRSRGEDTRRRGRTRGGRAAVGSFIPGGGSFSGSPILTTTTHSSSRLCRGARSVERVWKS